MVNSDYYQYLPPRDSIASRAAERARRKMFLIFMGKLKPTNEATVLDVGVTSNESYKLDNYLEILYPFKNRITAVGIEDGSHLEQRYPGIRFVKVTPGPLPFEAQRFDFVHSSAVIEHVGSDASQTAFLRELWRVARKGLFLTTPNRWFPIEFHTVLPLLHWLPKRWHRRALRALNKGFFATEENLNLLSRTSLIRCARAAGIDRPAVSSVSLLGWPTNLLLTARKPGQPAPVKSGDAIR